MLFSNDWKCLCVYAGTTAYQCSHWQVCAHLSDLRTRHHARVTETEETERKVPNARRLVGSRFGVDLFVIVFKARCVYLCDYFWSWVCLFFVAKTSSYEQTLSNVAPQEVKAPQGKLKETHEFEVNRWCARRFPNCPWCNSVFTTFTTFFLVRLWCSAFLGRTDVVQRVSNQNRRPT